jgi:DNA-binding SARP family transcriptional activator
MGSKRQAPAKLAKLERPRSEGLYERGRLFAMLDRARGRPVVWVSAPPGAGKTSLVASYVRARELSGLWYQVDPGDADISTFFHYLSVAGQQAAGRKKLTLPQFSAEYLPDPSGFARGFFRELFARMPPRAALVLDNYQEAGEEPLFHTVIREAIEQIPDGINLIVSGRIAPPAQLSRHVANGGIALLEWAELRLTLEEATDIGRAREIADELLVRQLHERSDGWAAGFTLMLEQTSRSTRIAGPDRRDSLETIFDYFAGQIFDAAPPEDQQVLMQTAFLPLMTGEMAERMSASAHAVKLLERLQRRHLFVDRRLGDAAVYQYHALFRTFLLARARQIFTPFGLGQMARRAAAILDAAGYREHAVALYLEAQDWAAAKAGILQLASELYGSARGQTLQQWIDALPAGELADEPWLLYWLGIVALAQQPRQAAERLERAYALFETRSDALGTILACAGIIRADYTDFLAVPRINDWIGRLVDLLQGDPMFPQLHQALDVHADLLVALHYRRPDSAFLDTLVGRLVALIRNPAIEAGRKSFAAGAVINYCVDTEDEASIATVLEQIRPLLDKPVVDRADEGMTWYYFVVYCLAVGDLTTARRCTEQMLVFSQAFGYKRLTWGGLWFRLILASIDRDVPALMAISAPLAAQVSGARMFDLLSHNLNANLALLRGDGASSLRHFLAFAEAAQAEGMVFFAQMAQLNVAVVRALRGEHDAALSDLARATALQEGTQLRLDQREGRLIEAYIRHARGEHERCRDLLMSVLTDRAPWLWSLLLTPNDLLPSVCAIALQEGIAREHVRQLIARFALPPPSPDTPHWPWPIRLYTLGDAVVQLNGEPLKFGHKAQRRPLELLNCLIALGGQRVEIAAIAASVWTDLDGDAALTAFHSALYRLRKLLGREDALELQDGKLSLSPRCCWVDAWAFERLVAAVDNPADPTSAAETSSAERAMQLYRGRFLEREGEPTWALGARDRFHSKYLRCAHSLGLSLERSGRWEDAATLYQRALELDGVAEGLYRRLMICYQRLGLQAEALDTYRRCREMLGVLLGAKPSMETESLHEGIRNG